MVAGWSPIRGSSVERRGWTPVQSSQQHQTPTDGSGGLLQLAGALIAGLAMAGRWGSGNRAAAGPRETFGACSPACVVVKKEPVEGGWYMAG